MVMLVEMNFFSFEGKGKRERTNKSWILIIPECSFQFNLFQFPRFSIAFFVLADETEKSRREMDISKVMFYVSLQRN